MQQIKILKKEEDKRENILSLLHALQRANPENYLSEEDLKAVASYLSLPLSEVLSVATFYSMYSLKPRGKFVIRLCDSPPCYLANSISILEEIKKELGIEVGETTSDGLFTLELSSCLGVCAQAPAMMINDQVYGNLDPKKVFEILDELRREK